MNLLEKVLRTFEKISKVEVVGRTLFVNDREAYIFKNRSVAKAFATKVSYFKGV